MRQALDASREARLADGIKRILAERGMSVPDFARAVYGRREDGNRAGGASVYKLLNGKSGVQRKTLARWAPVLGLTVEELEATADAPGPPAAPRPPARAEPARLAAPDPDQFSLVVNSRGRATLRLNLVDVPMDRAMQLMAALTSAGLLGTEGTSE